MSTAEALQPDESGYPWWGNVPNKGGSPELILAQELEARGLELSISPNSSLPDTLSVYLSPRAREVFLKIHLSLEFSALYSAIISLQEPQLQKCDWDDEAKARVMALY